METLRRPDLRKIISEVFKNRPVNEFKTVFLVDYFYDLYRNNAGKTDEMELVSKLFEVEYDDDGRAIVNALIDYAGKQKVTDAIDKILGAKAKAAIAAYEQQPLPRPVPLLASAREDALKDMRNAHGLVIGIGKYQPPVRVLNNTIQDANDVTKVLIDRDLCGYPREQVTTLLDADATKQGIIEALQQLAKRTDADSTVFIYAACHGGNVPEGEYRGQYLLPVDATSRRVSPDKLFAERAISEPELSALIAKIPSRKLMIVLDCCYAAGTVGLRGDEDRSDEDGLASEWRADALKQLLTTGRGRVILAAANREQTAKELATDKNGLFTKHLLAGLRGAGGGSGPFVRIFELYEYIHAQVCRTALDTPQVPVFKADVEGNFPIAVRAL